MIDRREFLRLGMVTSLGLLAGCRQSTLPTQSRTPVGAIDPTPEQGFEFIVRNRRPKDLETPVEVFETYLTPNERFFVRSHHPEPKVSQGDWRLQIQVGGSDSIKLNFEDLKAFNCT